MTSCPCENLYAQNGFESPRFYSNLLERIAESNLIEVPVKNKYEDVGEVEHWYKCPDCKRVWRLVEPDYPSKGAWEVVK